MELIVKNIEFLEAVCWDYDINSNDVYTILKTKKDDDLPISFDVLRKKVLKYVSIIKLQEIFRFSNEATKTGVKYDHDTVKPEKMTRALVLTCSRPGDLVVVPFAGSGTECAMSVKEGRQFVGFEIDAKHVRSANGRAK